MTVGFGGVGGSQDELLAALKKQALLNTLGALAACGAAVCQALLEVQKLS